MNILLLTARIRFFLSKSSHLKKPILFIFLFFTLFACELVDIGDVQPSGTEVGVRPIYADAENWNEIIVLPPQPIGNLGKIYYYDPYIFVNERLKGIHVIDNSDPSNPIPLLFIQVFGSEDIAVKDDILYVDNYTDLVAIDISDFDNITEVSRVKDLYSKDSKAYPEGYSGFFECVDESKGIVIGWEEAAISSAECIR
ncbi:MAG: hypothetical protein AAF849_05320 [Bacteroidota bacterium]